MPVYRILASMPRKSFVMFADTPDEAAQIILDRVDWHEQIETKVELWTDPDDAPTVS